MKAHHSLQAYLEWMSWRQRREGEDFLRTSIAFTAALAEGMVVKQGTR